MNTLQPDDWEASDGVTLDAQTLEIVKLQATAVVVAGPGAGKTELLAQRASFLLQTNACSAPRRILAISFKRDAAKNLRDRVRSRVGPELARRLESFTFDAFAKSLVDRFSQALPSWCRPSRTYSVIFPSFNDWAAFANALPFGVNGQQLAHAHTTFAGGAPLPMERPEPNDAAESAALAWWNAQLGAQPSRLTFGMISVLAITILRHNPMIANALRRTYSHIFLDEFQDTTGLQYQLVSEIFKNTPAILTAVGDTKQRIMTWAGALPENFESFISDFGADYRVLTSNFRSNPRIVEIVNAMARQIEPDAVEVVSARADTPIPDPADGILRYASASEEAQSLAAWVAAEVASSEIEPGDILLLVRQRADQVEDALSGAFAQHGLVIRNEARVIGNNAIQELMTEPLSDLVIAVMQLATGDRTDAPYQRVWDALGDAFGLDDERPAPQLRLEATIRKMASGLRTAIETNSPSDTDFTALFEAIYWTPLGRSIIVQLSPDYENELRLGSIISSIIEFLTECGASAASWPKLINSYVGRSQVRLMTIHKSKGLEAHTTVFLHLQDNAFYSGADMEEEKLAFFVAVSRARERLFVTTTSPARQRTAALWEMVDAAQLPVLK